VPILGTPGTVGKSRSTGPAGTVTVPAVPATVTSGTLWLASRADTVKVVVEGVVATTYSSLKLGVEFVPVMLTRRPGTRPWAALVVTTSAVLIAEMVADIAPHPIADDGETIVLFKCSTGRSS